MTTEVKERPSFGTGEMHESRYSGRYQVRRSWMPCPRCIGGNMYSDNNGEHVCIQCSYSYFPERKQSVKMG